MTTTTIDTTARDRSAAHTSRGRWTRAPRVSLSRERIHFARNLREVRRGSPRMRLTRGLVGGR